MDSAQDNSTSAWPAAVRGATAAAFGHRAGAFSGAIGERAGLLGEAGHGTMFLEEINALLRKIRETGA